MKKLKNFWVISFLCIMLCGFTFWGTACTADGTIELYQPENVYEVVPGGELQFSVKLENVAEEDIEYAVASGAAVISETGLLTVDAEADVGEPISVYAQAGDVKSNTITVNVIDLKPQSITLTADKNKLIVGGEVEFSVNYTPNNATLKEYTLAIVGGTGQEYVNLNGNILAIKAGTDEGEIDGKTVEVKATLIADETITSTFTVNLATNVEIETLAATTINYNVAKDSNKYLQIHAYNSSDYLLDLDLDNFTYESSDPNIATITSDGKIIPHGHGKTVITITALNGSKETTCDVYVMVPPKSLGFNNVSTKIANDKIMSYSKLDTLNLDIDFEVDDQFVGCSQAVSYSFELLDEDGHKISTPDTIATVDANGINFEKTGKVKVIITSNSSLNGVNTTEDEQSVELIVNVNEGVNVDTIAELKAFANQTSDKDSINREVNINADMYLTADENFGSNTNHYETLLFFGDVIINGNGYVISNTRLPLLVVQGDANEGQDFLRFDPYINPSIPRGQPGYYLDGGFSVEVNDLTVVGCGSVSGIYSGELESDKDKTLVIPKNGTKYDYIRTYRRGIRIAGGDYAQGRTNTYVEKLTLKGVEVKGFDAGIRIEHAVDALLDGITVSQCYGNGIESAQNIMTVNNITVKQVGAFAIELTPDDMKDKSTNNPSGTAGAEYNQTNKLTLTGNIDCENYNNGASTKYMENFKLGTYNLMQIVDTVGLFTYSEIAGGNQTTEDYLKLVYDTVLKKDTDGNGTKDSLNLYLLIFINTVEEFTSYQTMGNTEGKFAQYQFKENLSDTETITNMINMTQLLTNCAQEGQGYEGYKKYKYICVDLNTGAQLAGNIGQLVLVNEAYDPNYTEADA